MARKKAEPTRSEIEAAVMETAEKTAAQPEHLRSVVACITCGYMVQPGSTCPTDGTVAD